MPSMMGSFILTKSDNFEEYMKAIGVSFMTRKLGASATPVTDISKNGDKWSIKTTTTFKTTLIEFKLGQEFDETTADGRVCKSVITQEGDNKLIHVQQCAGQKSKILREFSDKEMKMVLEAPGNIVSTRIYKRQ